MTAPKRLKHIKRTASALVLAFAAICAIALGGCTPASSGQDAPSASNGYVGGSASSLVSSQTSGFSSEQAASVTEDGRYTDKDRVAAYIHKFRHLPPNYISKTKARRAGWVSTEGNLWDVLPGMSIGGSEFYPEDSPLPQAAGRRWTECDVNYQGGYRGAERIVFSDDGLIFYTADHYRTFEQLY